MPDYLNKIYYRNFTGSARFVKLPTDSCISPYAEVASLTLIQCEDYGRSKNAQYISRAATAMDTAASTCYYTTAGGGPTGGCDETVYGNPCYSAL